MKTKPNSIESQNSQSYVMQQQNELLQLKRYSALTAEDITKYSQDKDLAFKYVRECVQNNNIRDLKIFSLLGIFNTVLSDKYMQISIVSTSIYQGKFELVDFFISAFKDIINFQDGFGNTPVMQAIKFNRPEIVSFLCEKGADLNIADVFGVLPLQLAQSMKTDEILKIITPYIEKKSSINKDKEALSLTDSQDSNAKQQSSDDSEWEKVNSDDYHEQNQSDAHPIPEATTSQNNHDNEAPASRSFAILIETGRKVAQEKNEKTK